MWNYIGFDEGKTIFKCSECGRVIKVEGGEDLKDCSCTIRAKESEVFNMSDKMKKRLTSKVTWLAIGALVLEGLVRFNVIDLSQMADFKAGLELILNALVIFGILNDPTVRGKF